jgi:hypothetical protein
LNEQSKKRFKVSNLNKENKLDFVTKNLSEKLGPVKFSENCITPHGTMNDKNNSNVNGIKKNLYRVSTRNLSSINK